MQLDVRSDINAILRKHDDLRDQILRAAAAAVNQTAKDVREAAITEIAQRVREYKKQTVKGYVTIKQAKFRKHRSTQSGQLRVNYGGISATVNVSGKAPNLIYFVTPSARFPAAWRQGAGVAAHVAGKTTVYDGSFIVKTKSGKMVVVSRSAKAKADPKGMRVKGKWQAKWSKGLYGPALPKLAATQQTIEAMDAVARIKWPAYWKQRLAAVIGGDE